MTKPDELILDIFGRSIPIQPNAYVVHVKVLTPEVVEINYFHQDGRTMQLPVNTVDKYAKTADQFAKEFYDQVWNATGMKRNKLIDDIVNGKTQSDI